MFDKINLSQCPELFQQAVRKKVAHYNRECFSGCELLNTSVCDTNPYLNKKRVLCTYRALLLVGNMFVVLRYTDGSSAVSEDSVIFGEIMDMLEHAPSWAGLPNVQQIHAEETRSA